MADGRTIADGPASELLAGGWYFATETARILGGAGGALLPEQGAKLLAAEANRVAVSSPGAQPAMPHGSCARGVGADPAIQGLTR
jgi:energy-coupling factor transport system ATP-binding protein